MAKTQLSTQIPATCVSIAGKGVLLLGESGSGKSDLALRLIDSGATLVGDDQLFIQNIDEMLLASPAPNIQGMIEARGIGILKLPYHSEIPLVLAVELVGREYIERMPDAKFFDCPMISNCIRLQLPLVSLHAFDSSTPAKIRLYVSSL